jgi:hypothetical protein
MMDYNTHICDAYRDLREPDYTFVRGALKAGRHNAIGAALLQQGFSVVDDTEPNSDVCRALTVARDNFQAAVKLSFVGPFAAVFRLQGVPTNVLLQPYKIALLDLDEQPTVYNALFSTDPMPS